MKKMIPGEGPLPCDVCIIGESGGWQEERARRPFVGKTGDWLMQLLQSVGLRREQVYLTNLYKFYPEKTYQFTRTDREAATPVLLEELRTCQPTVVVPLGRHAVQWLMGDTVSLNEVWGLPWRLPQWPFVIVPMYHPAAGLHSPELAAFVVAGWNTFSAYRQGLIAPRSLFDDPLAGQESYAMATLEDCQTLGDSCAVDTEGWPEHPWSLQWSTRKGHGRMIRANDTSGALALFREAVRTQRPRLIFHNALHDLAMLSTMGITIECPFEDTMVMAYLLQIEDQGLKALAARHCGMTMESYDEIMRESADQTMRDWLMWVWDGEQEIYEARCQAEFDARRAAGRRIRKVPLLPKTMLQKAVERCLQSKTPRALWEEQIPEIRVVGETAMGEPPPATLDYVSRIRAVRYGCRDADATLRVYESLSPQIDAMGLRAVYDLEMSTYPLIARMHQIGMKPDLPHFARLSAQLETEYVHIAQTLRRMTGDPAFNANSGDKCAAYLFDQCGLEPPKRTASGRRGSTNDTILEVLDHEHPDLPVIGLIRRYREVYKLKHTFVDQLPALVDRYPYDGRIHATFRTTRVVTGRLAASDPNVLAQPEHGAFANDFKRGWIADPGHLLCSWDESQIELRGLAHLSQDPIMLAVFRGEQRNPDGSLIDLHAMLAERIFGVPPHRQDKHLHRLPAKAINFGIPMGMTAHGLSLQLRRNGVFVDEDDAQRWLDETLTLYAGVARYMVARIDEAKQQGFVRCLSGRIRYIGGIHSRDDRIRAEAERFVYATPIQESAQFIMKQAEIRVWAMLQRWWRRRQWVEPLVQIHDALKLEVEMALAQELHREMVDCMTQVPVGFSVPLVVEGEYGPTFAEMQPFVRRQENDDEHIRCNNNDARPDDHTRVAACPTAGHADRASQLSGHPC